MGDNAWCPMCNAIKDERDDARTFAKMLQQQNAALKQEVCALNKKLEQQHIPAVVAPKKSKKKKTNQHTESTMMPALQLQNSELKKELELIKKKNEELQKQLDVEKDLRNRAEKELKTNRENVFIAIQASRLQQILYTNNK